MREKGKPKNKKGIPKIPRLHLHYRLLLYLLMVVFIILSLISAVFKCFPYMVEIVCYVLAAITLFVGSYYLTLDVLYGIKEIIKPRIVANPYTNRVVTDYRLRTILFIVPGLASNVVFAVFNGIIGIISHSAWFGSLSAYYILLSMMRIGVVKQERKISKIRQEKEQMEKEIVVYKKNSILFILMAVVLGGMVILLEASLGGKNYKGFTIYAVATYAFYRIIMSTIHIMKANKQKSPLLMIIRKIGYIDACVSILTLQTAMFTSFAQGKDAFTKMMNGITGAVVSLMVLGIGIQGIYCAKKMKIKWIAGGNNDD